MNLGDPGQLDGASGTNHVTDELESFIKGNVIFAILSTLSISYDLTAFLGYLPPQAKKVKAPDPGLDAPPR